MTGEEIKNNYHIDFERLREVLTDTTLTIPARFLLVNLLFNYARTNNNAFPSQKTLASDLGISERYTRTILKELKDKNKLNWKKIGFSKSNRYIFMPDLYIRIDGNIGNQLSYQSGSQYPVQTGTSVPPKILHEGKQFNSSQLLQLFEKANKAGISEIEKRRFVNQTAKYNPTSVEKAIKEAISRNKFKVNTAYVTSILKDWEQNGEPQPPPKFQPCNKNGCDDGFIIEIDSLTGKSKNICRRCNCYEEYEAKYKTWKKMFG